MLKTCSLEMTSKSFSVEAMVYHVYEDKYCQNFTECNFRGLKLICEKCENCAPQKFAAIRYGVV